MDTRKQHILNTVIKEHIKTGSPVGSSVIVDKYKLDVSSATVRNDMASLEEEGYIIQPYTSAGRIPTEKAYNLYINSLMDEDGSLVIKKQLGVKESADLKSALKKQNDVDLKKAAKELAGLSGNAVFWAFHRNNLYYTGISNLLSQPEFSQANLIYDMSYIIDQLDEIINKLYDDINKKITVMIGQGSPFGGFCGAVIAKYKLNNKTGLFGILGPIRMDYERNLLLINHIIKLL